ARTSLSADRLPGAARPRPGCLLGCGGAACRALRPHGLLRRGGTRRAAAVCGRALRLLRQRRAGRRAPRLALQRRGGGPRGTWTLGGLTLSLAGLIGQPGVPAGPLRGRTLAWRRKVDAGAPRFRQADGDGLLRVAGAMLAMADPVD